MVVSVISISRTAAAPGFTVKNDNTPPPEVHVIKSVMTDKETESASAVKGISTLNVQLPPAHAGLSASAEPQLRKLAEYEQAASGAAASGMMIFTDIPSGQSAAVSAASEMATKLKNFAAYGIKPIVIMEPVINGNPVDFGSYRNGAYDSVLNKYFSSLKNFGLNDTAMGIWVFFPEANLPEWGPVDTADFAPNVTRTVDIQKKYFPASQSSILLDAQSYPAGSTSWDNGTYVSLAPYVSGIPKGTLDSFGLQGFPWAPPANEGGPASYDSAVYLNASLASQAAHILNTSNVWFNTGTFGSKYTNSASQIIHMPAYQRQQLLNGVLSQAASLKGQGFTIEVNLFSEDKSNTAEATDWSYGSADEQAVFKTFSQQLYSGGISLWLFDA
jgi:hypothetical protein